jgi:hypothetical protein
MSDQRLLNQHKKHYQPHPTVLKVPAAVVSRKASNVAPAALPKAPTIVQRKMPLTVPAVAAFHHVGGTAQGTRVAPPPLHTLVQTKQLAGARSVSPLLPLRSVIPATLGNVVQRSRNNFKHYVGKSGGTAIRMAEGTVTATGVLTLPNKTSITKKGKNGDSNWNLGTGANAQWYANKATVANLKSNGAKIPDPSHDAEVSVLQQLRDEIVTHGLKTTGGTLTLNADGTTICVYCRSLITAFCKHYGLKWK